MESQIEELKILQTILLLVTSMNIVRGRSLSKVSWLSCENRRPHPPKSLILFLIKVGVVLGGDERERERWERIKFPCSGSGAVFQALLVTRLECPQHGGRGHPTDCHRPVWESVGCLRPEWPRQRGGGGGWGTWERLVQRGWRCLPSLPGVSVCVTSYYIIRITSWNYDIITTPLHRTYNKLKIMTSLV